MIGPSTYLLARTPRAGANACGEPARAGEPLAMAQEQMQ